MQGAASHTFAEKLHSEGGCESTCFLRRNARGGAIIRKKHSEGVQAMHRANCGHELMHFCHNSGRPKFFREQVSNANATAGEQWEQL